MIENVEGDGVLVERDGRQEEGERWAISEGIAVGARMKKAGIRRIIKGIRSVIKEV